MLDDAQALRDLNHQISDAEDRGDATWLSDVLAPRLAFQRADCNRTVDDQVAFLQRVAVSGPRTTRIVEPVQVHGDRAVVECLVTVDNRTFHNLRVFVRRDKKWKLLAWANEAV
jgi:hypothetical protein